MNVCLAHDSFTQLGGAERLFLEVCKLYPEAPIYTLVVDKKILKHLPESVQKRIRVSPLQWFYNLYPKFQHLVPFIPLALWLIRVPQCKVLLTSSSAFIKGLSKPAGSTHIDYCHTPTRFLWSDTDYVKEETPRFLLPLAKLFFLWMKTWDLKVAKKVDVFLANSKEVQVRIKKYYQRESEVVYPFVEVSYWQQESSSAKKDYFLIAGRLHAHKNNDLVVRACTELGLPLHVAGRGRDEERLKTLAGPTVKFLGRLTDTELKREYQEAKAYVYPQLEDFGMMPLEAQGSGTPVIAANAGGALETVVPGKTGEFFKLNDFEDLKRVLLSFDPSRYDRDALIGQALKFDISIFREKLMRAVNGQM